MTDRIYLRKQSHVICTPGAGAVIKTYSPNLMVHPLMRQSPSQSSGGGSASPADTDPDQVSSKIIEMLSRLHVLVIGPGLGRDPLMQKTCAKVLAAAREQKMPVVLDADALAIVSSNPELFIGWEEVVLTPNVVEFGRLWKGLKVEGTEEPTGGEEPTAQVEALSQALGGVTIVQKGGKDMISNGKSTMVVDLEGGLKRSGGQGDTLTGSIATFLGWRRAYMDGLWDHGNKLDAKELLGLAAFGGAAITRVSRRRHPSHHPGLTHGQLCSRNAFKKKGRSLQASDLTDEVYPAFLELFGENDPDADNAKL